MSECSAKELEIDVTRVDTQAQLHELLAEKLGFPDYYGGNWDAFNDCVRDIEGPLVVRVKGFARLRFRLPRDAKIWTNCARDLEPDRVRFSFDGS
jgi:ribonuclease inhibitor